MRKAKLVFLHLLLETPETYTNAEQENLHDCLMVAPGITAVSRVERHPKGGYAAFVENTGDLGPMLEHLEAYGYRPAI
ncbi:MAG: hypothetical protein M3680_06335 [Myxococcota bacterium]|nr:hypothetical protein [Myxococcota bacterium]